MPIARDTHLGKCEDADVSCGRLRGEVLDHLQVVGFVSGSMIELHGADADVS